MLIPFVKTDQTLNSEPFLTEEVRFNLLHRIAEGAAVMLRREDGRAIIAQSGAQFPAWIWTDDDLTAQELHELAEDFCVVFANREKLELVAKPSIAEFLANEFSQRKKMVWRLVMDMEAYHCPTVQAPQGIPGEIARPTMNDVTTIANFFVGFIADGLGKTVTVEQMLESAKQYILSRHFYVWNVAGEIVSMANIAHRSLRHARINEVYTPPQQRKKGYASALVAALSQTILADGKIPMLYADTANPDSNKVYRNIGYLECGKVRQLAVVPKEE